jgi:dipeptidyl aminopeptidase/acylaminoacyl peptidase
MSDNYMSSMRARIVLLAVACVVTLSASAGCVARRDTIAFVASLRGTNGRVVVTASRPDPDVLALSERGRYLNLGQLDQLWSNDGRLVYLEGKGRDPVTWLSVVTMAGSQRRLLNVEALDISSLSISRDGLKVLIALQGSRVVETPVENGTRQDTIRFSAVDSIDTANGAVTHLASVDNMSISRASYSPDRRLIAFVGRTDDPQTRYNIYAINADGEGIIRCLTKLNAEMNPFEPPRWSPDGTKILYSLETLFIDDITHYDDLFVLDVGSGKSYSLTDTPNADDGQYCWSPDGQRVAFYSGESPGVGALCVIDADGANRKEVISNAGSPSWADIDHLLGRWLGSGILRIDLNTRQTEIVVPLQDSYGSLSSPLRIGR